VIFGIVWGTLLAMMRLSPVKPLSWFAAGYVNLFRAVPLVMVLLWFFLIVPQVLRGAVQPRPQHRRAPHLGHDRLRPVRVGLLLRDHPRRHPVVPKGQVAAASALGMTYAQAMRLVVLPQAFRNMVPLLLTQAIVLFQDTSLVYVSALADFFGAAYKVGDRDGRLVELLLFAGAVYFVICFAARSWCAAPEKILGLAPT
jgi:glutamate/aspartate transport system permease protein